MHGRGTHLVEAAFAWAREVAPEQPLTSGRWQGYIAPQAKDALDAVILANSDVVTFHNYGDTASLQPRTAEPRAHGRPVPCTEWMTRRTESLFATHLPWLAGERISRFFWGLVNGRSRTHFPWGSEPGAPEPEPWFHDLLRRDGTPYDPADVALIGRILSEAR